MENSAAPLSAGDRRSAIAIDVRPFREGDRPRLREIFLASRRMAFHWLMHKRYALDDFDAAIEGEEVWVAEAGSSTICSSIRSGQVAVQGARCWRPAPADIRCPSPSSV
jgi:hypothetical protein